MLDAQDNRLPFVILGSSGLANQLADEIHVCLFYFYTMNAGLEVVLSLTYKKCFYCLALFTVNMYALCVVWSGLNGFLCSLVKVFRLLTVIRGPYLKVLLLQEKYPA